MTTDPKGSILTTLMLFAFLAIFGYDIIVHGAGNPLTNNTTFGIVWLVMLFIAIILATVDWNKKHPELDRVDDE